MESGARTFSHLTPTILFACLAVACADGAVTSSPTAGAGGGGGSVGEGPGETAIGSCVYVNPFSAAGECKRYTGESWTAASASTDCTTNVVGTDRSFVEGDACTYPDVLGVCSLGAGSGFDSELVFPGADPAQCAATARGCEVFAQGTFEPGPPCEGVDGGGGGSANVFVQPYQVCQPPLEGEPPGQSEGGDVCTWTLISASTEEGRHYADYASCDDVRTQRPYYGTPPASVTPADDPRLLDGAYLAEVAWARQQVEASACVCCHSSAHAPDGPSQWFVEAEGVWLDSISDPGLAMMAGLADSTTLGAFDPADNNGFDRSVLGVPTTDNDRMAALLRGEWERRGFTPEDAASIPPFGGPLVDQLGYQPSACDEGQGMASDGTLRWTGGDARYLYVLDVGSANPGVPPNLDEPEGTRWLVDVPTAGRPFASGLAFGTLTGDMRKRLPATAPAPLTSGTTYYLVVLQDVGVPLARCLFVAP